MLMSNGIKWLIVLLLGGGAAGFVVFENLQLAPPPPSVSAAGLPIERVTVGDRTFDLEVAATQKHVQDGLSKRATIPDGTGMLFVFPSSRILSFWMIDCLVDIDVAYLDRTGKVVSVYTMKTEPAQTDLETRDAYMNRLKRYPSADDCLYAIELPAGAMTKLGVKPGTMVKLNFAKLRSLLR